MKNKVRVAFEMLKEEFEILTDLEAYKGGEDPNIYDNYISYLNGQLQLLKLNQPTDWQTDQNSARAKTKTTFEKAISEVNALKNSQYQNAIFFSSNQTTGGYTDYIGGTVVGVLPNGASENWELLGHEIHHQYQFLNGSIDKNNIEATYDRNDEFESYQRQAILKGGVEYFLNQTENDRKINEILDSKYGFSPSSGYYPEPTGGGFTTGDMIGAIPLYVLPNGHYPGDTGPSQVLISGYDDIGYFEYYETGDPNIGSSRYDILHMQSTGGDMNAILAGWENKMAITSSGQDEFGDYFGFTYMDANGNMVESFYHPDYHMVSTGE